MNDAPDRAVTAALARIGTVFERPADWQPPAGTIDDVVAWLLGPARDFARAAEAFDELCWRLVGAGLPLARMSINGETLHPLFFGYGLRWWRAQRRTEYAMARHEMRKTPLYLDSPVARCIEDGLPIRRRIAGTADADDFPILADLREQGITDYLVLPIRGARRRRHVGTFATDRSGGFTDADVAALARVAAIFGILVDHYVLEQISRNVVEAYLGATTGPRVLAGQIRRGSGERLHAVIWSSDIRGFTERSERLDGERVVALLNACFEAQGAAIEGNGGEVLKFIGDGLLAIFPIPGSGDERGAVAAAVAAAGEALAAVEALHDTPLLAGEPPLRVVIALHVGEVFYGNIGSSQRLDFTVIGPAVNLVSRAAEAAKTLDVDLILTEALAAAYGGGVERLGEFRLRGLAGARALFTPRQGGRAPAGLS
ncbi:MAG: adenylate/guanylate cyclase domain-containing protein [Alphaproteobacteria bacterium]|nr:adenylate/guanylate cyclase domain-containing protein [Alphaproteobacteria bacterium]